MNTEIVNMDILKEIYSPENFENSVRMPNKSHIKAENLNVYIKDHHILKDINLTVPDKRITCIIGPSGCGKTTLLRSFNRMHDDSTDVHVEGKLFVDGVNIYDKSVDVISIRKKMGLLAQRPCPLPMSI